MATNKRIIVVTAFMLAVFGVRAYVGVKPVMASHPPLADFPRQLGEWSGTKDFKLDDDVSAVLKADDYLSRDYVDPQHRTIDLFVAYYNVQKAGESMHSPKNCLPGAGWRPVINDMVVLENDAKGKPVYVNRYVIERGSERSMVLYWYQANGRIIASEYAGKFFLVYDALRTGRRDGSLVRLVLPLGRNADMDATLQEGLKFARLSLPELHKVIPD